MGRIYRRRALPGVEVAWRRYLRLSKGGRRPERQAAFAQLQALAERGDPRAGYAVGLIFRRGIGRRKDVARALAWWERAGRRGSADALFWAAMTHYSGHGVPVDLRRARALFRRAAAKGMRGALLWVAITYDFAEARRPALAVRWYRAAARRGSVDAMVNLAVCLERGDGARADLRRATAWYRRAARAGDRLAKAHLARLRRRQPLDVARRWPKAYVQV